MTTMVSSMVLSIVFAILSLTVNVNGQVCNDATQSSACSSNSNCGCLPYSFSNTMGVCGLITSACSAFTPCESGTDACAQSGYICVRHPQCSFSSPVCCPPSVFDESVCPPMPVSSISSALTVNSQNYTRYGSSGSFYYQAIEVRVATTGSYTFSTSSTIDDTYGYLYQGNFYPSYPQYNMITSDDDSAGNLQFRLTATLRSDITYILVFTTLRPRITGSFNIVASDPINVSMTPININT